MSRKPSKKPPDIDQWCDEHDQLAPQHWLSALLDGDITLPEFRRAVRENRSPRYTPRAVRRHVRIARSADA